MPTITATVGSASANSYVSAAEATTYFDERSNASAYTGETDADVQARALITASRRIEFYGGKSRGSAARSDVISSGWTVEACCPAIKLWSSPKTLKRVYGRGAYRANDFTSSIIGRR